MNSSSFLVLTGRQLSISLAFSGRYFDTVLKAYNNACEGSFCESDHLYHLSIFFKDIVYEMELIRANSLNTVDVSSTILILFDLPSTSKLRKILKNNFKEIILLEAECPLYTHRKMIENTWTVISPYASKYRSISTDTAFIYKEINCLKPEKYINTFVENSICMVASNIIKPPPFTYLFRRHLVNLFSVTANSNFYFYGRNWSRSRRSNYIKTFPYINLAKKNLLDTYQALETFKIKSTIKIPQVNLKYYRGELKQKSDLNQIPFSLAIENILNIQNYTTEKSIEPLTYNSFPIIVATKNTYLSRYFQVLPPNIFDVISYYQKLSNYPAHFVKDNVSDIRNSINLDLKNNIVKTNLFSLYQLLVK